MKKRKSKNMSETELRKYFDTNRGDESLWSNQPESARVGKKSSIVFSVRFTADELKAVKEQAGLWQTTISSFIRKAVLEWAPGRRYDVILQGGVSFRAVPLTVAGNDVSCITEIPKKFSTGH